MELEPNGFPKTVIKCITIRKERGGGPWDPTPQTILGKPGVSLKRVNIYFPFINIKTGEI